jgi:AraC-like DNA-binding protein
MLTHDYLGLHLNRLKRLEEWVSTGDGLAFVFPADGKGTFASGTAVHQCKRGDALVFQIGSGGKLLAGSDGDLVFRCFSVQLEHLFPLFANHEVHLLQQLQNRFRNPHLYQASSPIALECHRLISSAPPLFNLDHRSHLLQIAAVVLTAELAAVVPTKSDYATVDEHLDRVFERLSTDEILEMSVDDLAAKFHCSRRHLNRLFHSRFGLSISALRMELRLLKAASLLRDADAKVINVAEQSGFNHLGLFNTCFKRRFGVSPGQWRKQPVDAECRANASSGVPKCRLREGGLCPLAGPGVEINNPSKSAPETTLSSPSKLSVEVVTSRESRRERPSDKPSVPLAAKLKVRIGA